MERKTPFLAGENYHIYTRGVDKMVICKGGQDFDRLQLLLYLCNNTASIDMRKLLNQYKGEPFVALFRHPREDTLVEIAAYALMPNHLHLLLHEKQENGISRFMLKLMTAYSMYFNTKYKRSGPLFTRPFRSKHLNSDEYMRWVFSYIHTNPIELLQHNWKEMGLKDLKATQTFMRNHPYSSFPDYFVSSRPASRILETTVYSREDIRNMDELLTQLNNYKGFPFV